MKTILEGSRKEQARFLREIKLLRTMHTQHITRYMGWSVCPEGFVLLMEYMPGTPSGPVLHVVFVYGFYMGSAYLG